jgi:molybdenum cofactor cytidylyltransferase
VLLGDQPFISPQVIVAVLDHFEPGRTDAARAAYDGAPGHPVVLGARVMAAAGKLTGDVGARDLLTRFRVRAFEASHLCDPSDIDTPDQLEAATR